VSHLKKALEAKHILLMGMGSAVGVGLFLGSANAIKLAGPAVLISYLIGGLIAFTVLRALGEMTVHEPATGSFSLYASKYISPLTGYLVGWSYWIYWLFVALAEVSAVAVYMQLWLPEIPNWIWALSSLAIVGSVNMLSAKHFGEFEYWFSLIKLTCLCFMILLGLGFVFFGLSNGWQPIGVSHLWDQGGFMPQGFTGIFLASSMAILAYTGAECIGLSAAETKDPKKTIPKVINAIGVRLIVLYMSAMFIILCIFPWTNITAIGSPFVAMFDRLGLREGMGIINFVVITAALSSCNAGIFTAARQLFGLAENKQAPKIFRKISKNGIPHVAIAITLIIPAFGVIINYFIPEEAFNRVVSGMVFIGLAVWVAILVTQLVFRKKIGQEEVKKLGFPVVLHPYTTWFGIIGLILIMGSMIIDKETRLGFYVLPPAIVILTILYYVCGIHKNK
jgi:AAT family amino acid transporter